MGLPTPDMDDCCKKERCQGGVNSGALYNTCDPCGTYGGTFDPEACDCVNLGTGFIALRYWIIERLTNRYQCITLNPLGDTCGTGSPILRSFFASNATLESYDLGSNNAINVQYGVNCLCPGDTSTVVPILNLEYIDHEDDDQAKVYQATATAGASCRNDITIGRTSNRYVWIATLTVNTGTEIIEIINQGDPPGAGSNPGDCFDTPIPGS